MGDTPPFSQSLAVAVALPVSSLASLGLPVKHTSGNGWAGHPGDPGAAAQEGPVLCGGILGVLQGFQCGTDTLDGIIR